MSKSKDTDSHYVDNKLLLKELKIYKEERDKSILSGEDLPAISEYIGECIYLISSNLTNRPNFINYPCKDEMIGEAIIDCIKAVPNFNSEISSNPFAYFTQISWFAFLRTIKKEKKQGMVKFALVNRANGMGEYRKWLQDNGHLDPYSSEEDIQRYHYLTDEDIKEIDEATKKKTTKKKKKTSTKKKTTLFEDEEK